MNPTCPPKSRKTLTEFCLKGEFRKRVFWFKSIQIVSKRAHQSSSIMSLVSGACNDESAASSGAVTGTRKRAVQNGEDCSRKKTKHVFSRGDYVSWRCDVENARQEGRVLDDDGVTIFLAHDDNTNCIRIESWFRNRISVTRWRSSVKAGDIVRVRVSHCPWHVAKVRHVFRAKSFTDTIVVVEPAFLGHTISVPLSSLRLRAVNLTEDAYVSAMVASGFAFDDVNDSPSRWQHAEGERGRAPASVLPLVSALAGVWVLANSRANCPWACV